MDPSATLKDAIEALKEESLDETAQCLISYALWRQRGGFEPMIGEVKGDLLAAVLQLHVLAYDAQETRP